MKQTHFFLGANSAEGFYGLYDQLLDARPVSYTHLSMNS